MSHRRFRSVVFTVGLVLGLLSFDAASINGGTTMLIRDYKGISFPYGTDWTQRVIGWQTRFKCVGSSAMAGCTFILNQNMTSYATARATIDEVSSTVTASDYIEDYVPYYCEERAILIVLHEILIIPPECYVAIE